MAAFGGTSNALPHSRSNTKILTSFSNSGQGPQRNLPNALPRPPPSRQQRSARGPGAALRNSVPRAALSTRAGGPPRPPRADRGGPACAEPGRRGNFAPRGPRAPSPAAGGEVAPSSGGGLWGQRGGSGGCAAGTHPWWRRGLLLLPLLPEPPPPLGEARESCARNGAERGERGSGAEAACGAAMSQGSTSGQGRLGDTPPARRHPAVPLPPPGRGGRARRRRRGAGLAAGGAGKEGAEGGAGGGCGGPAPPLLAGLRGGGAEDGGCWRAPRALSGGPLPEGRAEPGGERCEMDPVNADRRRKGGSCRANSRCLKPYVLLKRCWELWGRKRKASARGSCVRRTFLTWEWISVIPPPLRPGMFSLCSTASSRERCTFTVLALYRFHWEPLR